MSTNFVQPQLHNNMANCSNCFPENMTDSETPLTFATIPLLVFNLLMLLGVLLPVTVGDALVLIALGRNKKIPIQIRVTLQSILLGCFIAIIALSFLHVTAVVLTTTNLSAPPREVCSFTFWLLSVGRVVRFVFIATFSVVVFVMVLKGVKAVHLKGLLIASIALWVIVSLLAAPVLSQSVVGAAYIGGAVCFPTPQENITIRDLNRAYIGTWIIIFGAFPLIITTFMTLATFCYIKKHKVSNEAKGNRLFLKAMTKLALFLVLGNSLNFLGQAIPPAVVIALDSPSSDLIYVALALFNLSQYPTPILMLVYINSIPRDIKALLLQCCCRKRRNRSPSKTTFHVASTDQTLDQ